MRMHKFGTPSIQEAPVREVMLGDDRREIRSLFADLSAEPGGRVRVFVPDWAGVDRVRLQAETAGLADRISVHHRAVLGCLGITRSA